MFHHLRRAWSTPAAAQPANADNEPQQPPGQKPSGGALHIEVLKAAVAEGHMPQGQSGQWFLAQFLDLAQDAYRADIRAAAGNNAISGQKRRAEPAEPPASKRSKPTQPLTTAEKEEWGKLATKYDRCAECGWHSKGQPHSSEDCKEKRPTLRNRFTVIRDLDKKGQGRFQSRTK
jgi:hypothetical protein